MESDTAHRGDMTALWLRVVRQYKGDSEAKKLTSSHHDGKSQKPCALECRGSMCLFLQGKQPDQSQKVGLLAGNERLLSALS